MTGYQIDDDAFLDHKRSLGDPPADEFVAFVFADPARKLELQQWLSGAPNENIPSLLKSNYAAFPFISEAMDLPEWANPKLMRMGSAFFVRHSETIMTLLGLLSLPYCYTAANGAMVLYISDLIRKQTTKRLYDTGVFVYEVMAPDAFSKTGNAYAEILKVRILHAAVRYYTKHGEKWDDAWGLPINQEDMAGTNLSFSLIVVRGLRMLGISVRHADQEAFIHLWAVIGYLTGLNEDIIAKNTKMAQRLDVAIKKRQFRISTHGQELTKSLTEHIVTVNKGKASAGDILGLMRYLLGSEIADMLAIKAVDLPAYKLALIKAINLFKSFKSGGDLHQTYRSAYATYKKQNPQNHKKVVAQPTG